MRYVFYERTNEGTNNLGFIQGTTSNIPEWLREEMIKRHMPDGTLFDRFNQSHVAQIPLMYRGSRLFVVQEVM